MYLDTVRLITILRERGYTVEISGDSDCWVRIQTVTADMEWDGTAKTTEEALVLAAQALYAYAVETVAILKPYLPEASQ